jgi:protoporphyrinogen IX oxidase
MFQYVLALHIIFIITWFSGLFYIVRLFVYNAEAEEKSEEEKRILHAQFNKMMKGLWYGITWPSAVLTLLFGSWTWYLFGVTPPWLIVKLCFVLGLYLYHFSLHVIFKQQMRGEFKFTSQQLRIWNEVATIFLVVIVMLVIVQKSLSVLWGIIGFVLFAIALMSAIKIYKVSRTKK